MAKLGPGLAGAMAPKTREKYMARPSIIEYIYILNQRKTIMAFLGKKKF
jgi:hypothetical protein